MIIDRSDIAAGDFDMEFNYDKVQWQYGDASIGIPPMPVMQRDGVSGYELPGSGVADAFLDFERGDRPDLSQFEQFRARQVFFLLPKWPAGALSNNRK